MSVHIGEVRAEVLPAAGPAGDRPAGAEPRDDPAELAAQARRRAAWLVARTCAEGFDD